MCTELGASERFGNEPQVGRAVARWYGRIMEGGAQALREVTKTEVTVATQDLSHGRWILQFSLHGGKREDAVTLTCSRSIP